VAIRIICASLVMTALSTAVAAQQSDAFDACAAVADSTARVACFDRALAARHAAQGAASKSPAAVSTAPPATAGPPATQATDSTVGLDARQVRKLQEARGEPTPPPPAPITARLVRVIPRQPLISAFELDNGQIWEQVESMKLSPEPQELITIRPGLLGAFFLKTAAGAVVRVHRLR
jgi:hypothetical protein